MAGLFRTNNANQVMTQRQQLEGKYVSARSNLLLIVVFTLINIILLVAQGDVYFLFSAFIPYYLMSLGMVFCGMYSDATQSSELAELVIFDRSAFAVFAIICAVILAMYLLAWILTKKPRIGWMIFGLVIFSLDTVMMLLLGGIYLENIIDILFHAWAIYSLSAGIAAFYKLKKLPPEEEAAAVEPAPLQQNVEL